MKIIFNIINLEDSFIFIERERERERERETELSNRHLRHIKHQYRQEGDAPSCRYWCFCISTIDRQSCTLHREINKRLYKLKSI